MTDVFIAVLNMSLIASFVALGVMILRMPLKKAPKICSYALWAIVLFKLLCPFTIETALSLIPLKAEPVPQNIIYAPTPAIDSGIAFVDRSINQALTYTVPLANFSDSANPMQGILFALACLWLAGAALLLLYAFAAYFRLQYRLREAIPRQNYYETDRIKTAFVLGFALPKIYVPVGLSEQETDYILKHEQTHIRRYDYLIKPLAFMALCLHWFNPLVWFSYCLAMRDMELSCDESVLKHYGSDIRRDYSNSLLSLSSKQNGLISPLAFGETGVKGRIHNVLKYKKPAVWVSAAAIAAVIVAALLLLPNAARDANTIAAAVTENITLEYSDESGVYTEIYLKKTTDGSVTLLTEDGAEIITAEDVIPLPYVYAVKTNGKYDLLDKQSYAKTSSIAYDEIYCQKYPDGSLATSVMTGRVGQYWGLISAQGASLTNPQTQPFEDIHLNTYEEVWPIIAVIQGGRYGAIDYNGQTVIEAGWDYLAMDVYNVPNTVFVLDGDTWGALKLDQNLAVSAIDYSLTPPAGITWNYSAAPVIIGP